MREANLNNDIANSTVRGFAESLNNAVGYEHGKLPDNFTSEYIPNLIDALLELTNLFEVQNVN